MSNELQAVNDAIDTPGSDPLAVAKVRALMSGYHSRWQSQQMEVLTVEETFRLPIVNPETGRTSRTFTQGGKFDLTVAFDQKHWLMEHKSAGEEIADPSAPYWRRLAIDSQVSMYALANWQDGRKLDGTIYDVIRKPTIRPKQIAKAEQKIMLSEGTYFGFAIAQNDIADSAGIDYRETPFLYGLRLERETLDDPQRYYQRRPIPRLDGEILEWAGEMWQVALDIRQTQLSGGHYRNSGACMNYGRPCDFLGICSGYDTPDSGKWKQRESAHAEVDLPNDVLTHSRIRCYQTCRRLHHFKYDLRLERADDESAEALVFGALLHKALEAYFLFQKDNDHEHDDSAPAATEVAGVQKALAF